jgi:hypothetical protein
LIDLLAYAHRRRRTLRSNRPRMYVSSMNMRSIKPPGRAPASGETLFPGCCIVSKRSQIAPQCVMHHVPIPSLGSSITIKILVPFSPLPDFALTSILRRLPPSSPELMRVFKTFSPNPVTPSALSATPLHHPSRIDMCLGA